MHIEIDLDLLNSIMDDHCPVIKLALQCGLNASGFEAEVAASEAVEELVTRRMTEAARRELRALAEMRPGTDAHALFLAGSLVSARAILQKTTVAG